MPVPVLELPKLIGEETLDRDSTTQLQTALSMVREASDTWHLPKQPEKYDGHSLTINGEEIEFWTLRVNDTHRLIYVIFEGCFFPLEFIANHHIANAKLFNRDAHGTRENTASEILARYIEHVQSQPTLGTAAAAAAAAAAASCTSSPVKRNQVVLTAKQVAINNQPGGKIVIAPAGAGKTVLAKTALEKMARTLSLVIYVAPTDRLAHETEKEFPDRLRENTQFLSWHALRAMLIEAFPELNIAEKREANFEYFQTWYKEKERFDFRSTKDKQKILIDAALLYAEFTQIIIQSSNDPQAPYLSKENYFALGENAAYVSREKRAETHDLFCNYLRELSAANYFEPHIHAFYLARQLQRLKERDPQHPFFIEGLAVDEMQRLHSYIMRCLLLLLKNPQAGNFFLCGDPHQLAGAQRRRVLEPVIQLLDAEKIPYNVFQLDENHRNAQSVVALSNMFLRAEQAWFGSAERTGVFLLKAQETAIPGFIDSKNYDSTFADQVKQSANWVVLIPDTADLDEARKRWGNNVMHVSSAGGLEWDQVIFDGSEIQASCRELDEFSRENMPSSEGEIVYAQGKGRATPSLAARDIMHAFYTATTRARKGIVFIDTPLASKFIASISATTAQQPMTAPAITASSPQEWLELVERYIKEEAFVTAEDILWSANIWGSVEAGQAAQKRYASQPLNLDLCAAIARELRGEVTATQNQKTNSSELFHKRNWNDDELFAATAKALFGPCLSNDSTRTIALEKIEGAIKLSRDPLYKRYIFYTKKLSETSRPPIEQILTDRDDLIQFTILIMKSMDIHSFRFLCALHQCKDQFSDLMFLINDPGFRTILANTMNSGVQLKSMEPYYSFLHILISAAENRLDFGANYIQWIIDINNPVLLNALANDLTQPRETIKNSSLLTYLVGDKSKNENISQVFEKALLLIEKSEQMRDALLRNGAHNLIFLAHIIKNSSHCKRLCAQTSLIPVIAEALFQDQIFDVRNRDKLRAFINTKNGFDVVNHVLSNSSLIQDRFVNYTLESFTISSVIFKEDDKILHFFLGCIQFEKIRSRFKNKPETLRPFFEANPHLNLIQQTLHGLNIDPVSSIKLILSLRKLILPKEFNDDYIKFFSNLFIIAIRNQLQNVRHAFTEALHKVFGPAGAQTEAPKSEVGRCLQEIEDIIKPEAYSTEHSAFQAIIQHVHDHFSNWPSPVKKLFTDMNLFSEPTDKGGPLVFHALLLGAARMRPAPPPPAVGRRAPGTL